jgi:para-nitrobenzyl esterase
MAVVALARPRAHAPIVATAAGSLRGRSIPAGLVFQGIRYAQAPVGVRRYAPPEPVRPWTGVRDALAPGPDCPQVRPGALGGPLAAWQSSAPRGDDMLSLNVWTPAADSGRRPVMVWIHGGAFVIGSGAAPMYDGSAFARDGVVLVTLNYRLHVLGFIYLGELFTQAQDIGTLAILDQIAALRWVRENISAFGGDPDNVTISGQSAGAGCVGTLLGTPGADGLYRRAILQSGAASHGLPRATATRIAERVLELARIPRGRWPDLAHVSSRRLTRTGLRVFWLDAARLLGEQAALKIPFLPAVDGVALPDVPIERVRCGARGGIDLLIGTCADEYRAFTRGLPAPLRKLLPSVPIGGYTGRRITGEELLGAYAERNPGVDRRALECAVHGDQMFTVPAIRLAEAQRAAGGRARMYRFTWPSPIRGGALGACHGVDVPFAFDTLARAKGLWGRNPPQDLADALHGAWVRFAHNGDPGGGELPDWPHYDLEQRPTLEFGERRRLVNDPRRAERLLWEGVW